MLVAALEARASARRSPAAGRPWARSRSRARSGVSAGAGARRGSSAALHRAAGSRPRVACLRSYTRSGVPARGPDRIPSVEGGPNPWRTRRRTVVDAQAELEGKLKGKDATVHGRVRGEIALDGPAAARRGRARSRPTWPAESAEIAGEFKGDVRARSRDPHGEGARQGARSTPSRSWCARARGCRARSPRARRRARARRRPRRRPARRRRRPCRAPAGNARRVKLRELAARLGCELRGDGERRDPRAWRASTRPGPGDAHLPRQPALRGAARDHARGGGRSLAPGHETPLPSLVSRRTPTSPSRARWRCCAPRRGPRPGVHPSAQVDPSAVLGAACTWARSPWWARACGSARAACIHPRVVLYESVEVGEDCVLHSGVQRARGLPPRPPRRRAERRRDRRRRLRLRAGRRGPLPEVPAGRHRRDRGRRRDRRAHRHRPRGARRDPHRPRDASSTTWCRSATRSRSARTR